MAIAALVGLGTTWLALTRGTAFSAVPIGAWTAWPRSGTRDIDPYARAAIARSGELPVGSGDGVAFVARADDNGRLFDGRCDLKISGTTPQARFWTLTLYDPQGRLIGNAIERQGFTSQEIVRNADGSFDIVAAPRSRAGGRAMIRWLLLSLAGTLLGGIVHLVAVLMLPRTATQDAYSRLSPI